MMNNKNIAIIIVNYNGNADTFQCLESIDEKLSHSEIYHYDVFLVDNASSNPIINKELSCYNFNIHYIQSKENLGFAGGNNIAIQYIKDRNLIYDYYFLLNNDTVIIDNSVDCLINKMEETGVEIGGLVNYYYDNPIELWQAGSHIRPSRLSGKLEIDFDQNSDGFIPVDAIPGSSMMINSDVINEIGLFDERYFAYFEEVDFCVRAKARGFKVSFLPNTKILHKVGRSSTSRLKHYLRSRNTLLFYSQNYRNHMIIAYLRVILRTIKLIVKQNKGFGYIKPAIKGVMDYRAGRFCKGSMAMFLF